jgi:adenosylhomocysteinase
MAYLLDHTQLRVVHKYACQQRNKTTLANTRLILLEHILPTTEEFIYQVMNSGIEVFAVLGKPYSIDEKVAERLKIRGINVIRKSYRELDETNFLDELLTEALERSKKDQKEILIVEVGGYFAKPLTKLEPDAAQLIAGVVEDTTFGHNRYLKVIQDVPVPVFSVARSALKEIEARFVGRDAVAAIETVLRARGVSLAGRNALVIGYGMIGCNVARALQNHDIKVHVYDKHDFKNLRAYIDGFAIHKKRELIKSADLIFAATADQALSWEEIEECKDNAILASVGSRDTEFDIATLKEQSWKSETISPDIQRFTLPNSRNILVVRDGTAVNFLLPSLPVEVLDLVFAEVFLCMMLLLKKQKQYPPGELYQAPDTYLNEISNDWLRNVNS